MKRIGVDTFPLTRQKAGVGYYIFYLLDEVIRLKPESLFFLYAPSSEGDMEHFSKYRNVKLRICPIFGFSHVLWKETSLARMLWFDKIDLFWGATQTIPFFKRKGMKSMLTLYDFTYLIAKESMTPLLRIYLTLFMPRILKQADFIFPISHGTGARLEKYYGLKHHGVVYPPLKSSISLKSQLETEFKLKEHGLTYRGYIISIGTLEPRKNFIQLFQIYCSILKQYPLNQVLPLVLIGGGGWKNKEIKELISEAANNYPSHIKFCGYLDDEQLSCFLSGARYYFTLSLYEGYGMPLAEARICGTPTVCFDLPEMREAAENEGIFLKQENLETELLTIFVCNQIETKRPIVTNYGTNRQRALILSNAIDDLD